MQIKVKNVDVTNPPGKKYQQLEVVYGDEAGETKTKKLFSFTNPAVFATLKDAVAGLTFDITQNKNDKGYWDWTSATKAAEGTSPSTKTTVGSTRSTYETPEERAIRQRLIVRQSSLSNAIEFMKEGSDEDVLALADKFSEWVFKTDEPNLGDIPF